MDADAMLARFIERWAPHDRPQARVIFDRELDDLITHIRAEIIGAEMYGDTGSDIGNALRDLKVAHERNEVRIKHYGSPASE